MPILRLAYATQFLIALLAIFVLWSEVGGQSHLDLMPWYLKLGLGAGAAFAVVKATAASVSGSSAWNSGTLKWVGILVALLIGCGLASYYTHVYEETDEEDQPDSVTSQVWAPPGSGKCGFAARDRGSRVRAQGSRSGAHEHWGRPSGLHASVSRASGPRFSGFE
jgi:hypothetical protein